MFQDHESVLAAMKAGARGYVLKGADQDEIVRAIRAAAAGEAIFGPEIAARVISHFASGLGSTGTLHTVPRADRPGASGAGAGRSR
jgi:DNA-binding NarL/FixJ family response regulator